MNLNPGESVVGALVAVTGAVIALAAIGMAITCCSPSMPTAAQQASVGMLEAELDACVGASPTLPSYQLCRGAVLAKFGVDAGPFELDAATRAAASSVVVYIVPAPVADAGGDR